MKAPAPFRWPRKHFVAAMARASAAKAPAGELTGERSRALLQFIQTEVERSGEFPTIAAMMSALGVKHASTLDATLLRLLAGGFIARDVVARKGARRFYAYRLPTEQPKKKETPNMQSVDLTRPETATRDVYAVALIGHAPTGPWRVVVSQQPLQVLAQDRASYRDAIAASVFWAPSAAHAEGIAQHIETQIAPIRAKQNLRAPMFLMPGARAAVLIAETAQRLTVKPFDPAALQAAERKRGGAVIESSRQPAQQTMLRESARAVLRSGT